MKNYIYKVIVAVIALIIVFELTIGKKFNEINKVTENFFSTKGRKGIVTSIKNEMQKTIDKEDYLTSDERILINKFIAKIKNELSEADNN